MNNLERHELAWLARQSAPRWGGHIARGQLAPPGIQTMIDAGLIRRIADGYAITDAGRMASNN